ncbi:MAG TPA: tetratricopeptide repeat protein [Pyrinomonadaceae bacterium]|jgi:tetratricopeptide (TPR) repeat protein
MKVALRNQARGELSEGAAVALQERAPGERQKGPDAEGKNGQGVSRRRNFRPSVLVAFQALLLLLCLSLQPRFVVAQNAGGYDRLERAVELLRKGELAGAERELGAVLRESPREANALNLLGVVRAQQRRMPEAEQLFLRALDAKPTLLGAYLNLGQLYLELQKTDRALWAFTEAGRLAPDNPSVNFNLAALYEGKREYRRALEFLGKMPPAEADLDQLYLRVKSHLGLGETQEARALAEQLKARGRVPAELAASFAAAFAERKLFDEAIAILEAARDAARPSFALLYNLGTSYAQKGERARAEAAYLEALAAKPDDVPTLRALAGIARADGNLEKALSYLVRARKVAPDSPAVLYDFGWTALNLNLIYDAIQALERVHQMKPDEPGYLYSLGIARLQNGEAAKAQQLLSRYIELRPEDSRGYYVLGATLYSIKQYPQARTALERSLALSPYADTEYYLGMIAYQEGDAARAAAHLQSALKTEPNHPAAHTALGMVYAKQKNYTAARSELERAVELAPKDGTASYQLGLVYARLGEKERSQAMFARADKLRAEKQELVRFRLAEPPK